MNKNDIINNLKRLASELLASNVTKAKQVNNFIRLVRGSKIETFKGITISNNGNVNIGNVGEAIVLRYLGLEVEDFQHEVKTLVKDSPYTLKNKEVETVYLLTVTNDKKVPNGLYKLKAEHMLGKRITSGDLKKLPLVRVCGMRELIRV